MYVSNYCFWKNKLWGQKAWKKKALFSWHLLWDTFYQTIKKVCLKKIKFDCWSLGINNIVCVFQDFSDMLIDASIQHVCQRANETCCETDGWMVGDGEGEYLAVDSHHNIKHMNKWIVFIGILIFNNLSNTVWVYLRLLM